jgi:excisionase family DNA binding protein
MEEPALLTTSQVALLLQVTPRTVRRWARDGVLPRLRLGGRITRYRSTDIAALIDPTQSIGRAGEARPMSNSDTAGTGHDVSPE